MTIIELIDIWKQEEAQPFTGWDFSNLTGRMLEQEPPWSYLERAVELMQQWPDRRVCALLDMGTGGGERLLELQAHWPPKVVVTEDYPPNIELARERLEPLGVRVKNVPLTQAGRLPFANSEFDLALNRHSGINITEVARVLAPGGTFLTQQIQALWAQDLLAAFGAKPTWPDATLAYYAPRLEKAGLFLEKMEDWQGDLSFSDIGALVYYLKAILWLVPGFSVDMHLQTLLRLQRQIEATGKLVFEARKFLIEAQKPLVGKTAL